MDAAFQYVALFFLITGTPSVLLLLKRWVDAHVTNQRLRQWSDGAISFAGQAYIEIMKARQNNPTAPLQQLIDNAVRAKADAMMGAYATTAASLGAQRSDAQTRIAGQLGELLASDPTVSVAPAGK